MTADLGPLGAKEGPAIPYHWSPPSRLPRFLPVFALLLLLLPRPNRCRQALWVSVPLVIILAAIPAILAVPNMGGEGNEGNLGILRGVTFGLGAVWLLSPYLRGRTRWGTFLRVLAVMEAFALVSFVLGGYAGRDSGFTEMLIGVALLALLFSAALNLAGWSCRRRSSWLRLLLWLVFWLVAGLVVLFVVMSVFWGAGPLPGMATALLIALAISFAFLAPFLLLCFNNAIYGQRLKELLRLPETAPAAAAQRDSSGSTLSPLK